MLVGYEDQQTKEFIFSCLKTYSNAKHNTKRRRTWLNPNRNAPFCGLVARRSNNSRSLFPAPGANVSPLCRACSKPCYSLMDCRCGILNSSFSRSFALCILLLTSNGLDGRVTYFLYENCQRFYKIRLLKMRVWCEVILVNESKRLRQHF